MDTKYRAVMKRYPLSIFLFLCLAAAAQATSLSSFEFSTPEQEKAFRSLTEELRCLVCQNESLAGSIAELAQDLRREVYDMMMAGKSKDDIVQFMVARYGDFVLFQPPLRPSTYPLWFGPFVLFAVAGFFLFRTLQRKRRAEESALSDRDRERLRELLDDDSEKKDRKE